MYRTLDPGRTVRPEILLEVQVARAAPPLPPAGEVRLFEVPGGVVAGPTLAGAEVTRSQTFVNERRVLVVTYNSTEPPGTLGYTVVVRPGSSVGDHFHHQREERIVLLHGRAQFRLLDCRPDSPSVGVANLFSLDEPGLCVRIPTGVAHAVVAEGALTVLQVLASSDYNPGDDVHILLSQAEVTVPAS